MASQSPPLSGSWKRSPLPPVPLHSREIIPTEEESRDLLSALSVSCLDLFDEPIVEIDGDAPVEMASKMLIEKNAACLVVTSAAGLTPDGSSKKYHGLFDFADVNAYLLLAVNVHALSPEDLENPRLNEIVMSAKAGGDVPVRLACDLSDKDPLVTLPHDATLMSLLKVFSRGPHRTAILDEKGEIQGMISDRRLVQWFMTQAPLHSLISATIATPLSSLPLVSYFVISLRSDATILDAMGVMSDQGVSSVAVVESDPSQDRALLSAVSVTDVGRLVVPSQNKRVLATSLNAFIQQIRAPLGSTDGEEKYPVFSVLSSSTLGYTMQKLLATNAHRVFITDDRSMESSSLHGVVSMVDVLGVFARLAGISDVDPAHMRRHRRASSTSSTRSSRSGGGGSLGLSSTTTATSLQNSVASVGSPKV